MADRVLQVTAGGLNGATTAAFDSTTAKTLVISAAYGAAITISDSLGLTWVPGNQGTQGSLRGRMYYAQNPAGHAAHTVTVSGAGSAAGFVVSGYSGSYEGGDPLEAQQGGSALSSTAAGVGSAALTPVSADNFIVASVAHSAAISGFAAQAGFASAGQIGFSSGAYFGAASVWKAQSAATSIPNTTVVSQWTGAVDVVVSSMAFRAASAGPTVPGAPTIGTATQGNGAATVTFTAPGSDGGSAITSYTTTAYRVSDNVAVGNVTGASPATITGLVNGTAVYLKTKANNAIGPGPESAASNSVTPAGGGVLTAGAVTLVSATSTTLSLSSATATGGTAPLTSQWHRSTTSNFTPGVGTAISGATGLTLADAAGLAQNTMYYYKLRVTDATSATADSNQVAGSLRLPDMVLGVIGDSIPAGYLLPAGQGPVEKAAVVLSKLVGDRKVTIINRAIPGTSTADWLPGSANLTNAIAAFVAAGATHVDNSLGLNDAAVGTLRSVSAYLANQTSIAAAVKAAGLKMIVTGSTYAPAGANGGATSAASVALNQAYQVAMAGIIDNVDILRGATAAFPYFANHVEELHADKTHQLDTGSTSHSLILAHGWHKAIYESGAAPALTTRTVSIELEMDDPDNPHGDKVPAANLTGLSVTFYDEPNLDQATTARYRSAAETTDGSGVLTFSFGSTLAPGAFGSITVRGPAGVHYNGTEAVS